MLIALAVVGHQHYHLVRRGWDSASVQSILTALHADPRHQFWPDDLSYREMSIRGVIGHRQVTDACIATSWS